MPNGDRSTHLVDKYFDAQRPKARTHVAAEVEERGSSGEAGEDFTMTRNTKKKEGGAVA